MGHGKCYHEMANVGAAKYVVNYHDGQKRHTDGSPFYDIKLFKNKRQKERFVTALQARGYTPRPQGHLC